MQKTPRILLDQLLLVALCCVLYFPFLGTAPLWDFDEGYFATIAKEMCENGTWIVPVYNDAELGDKPILIFWGMILSMKLFGINEFAVRFPTVLWGIGTVLLTYHLARRLFQNRSIGLRAGFILATMLLFCVETRGTTCDGAMLFCQCAALTVFVYATRGFSCSGTNPKPEFQQQLTDWFPQNIFCVLLMYAFLTLSVLAKGPSPFILIVALLGLFLFVKSLQIAPSWNPLHLLGRLFLIAWMMKPLTAIGVALCLAGPWFFLVSWLTNWDWLNLFVIEHHFQRTVSSTRGHSGFPFFYTLTSLFGTFPWSIFFLPFLIDLIRRLWKKTTSTNAYIFSVCWVLLFYLFFSGVSTKLIHYVFPAYPALAILGSVFLVHWRNATDWAGKYWTGILLSVLPIVGIGMTVAFSLLLPKYFPELPLLYTLPLFVLVAGFIGIFAYLLKGRPGFDLFYNGFAVCFVAILFQFCVVQIDSLAVQQHRLIFPNRAENQAPPFFVSLGLLEPSWIFYYDHPIFQLELEDLEDLEDLEEGRGRLSLEEQVRHYFIVEEEQIERSYIPNEKRRNSLKGPLFILATRPGFDQKIRDLFGDAAKEVKREQAFLKNHDLVLFEIITRERGGQE
ncbi:MAG: ArnT family glycosyltransferase [Thermoguttaceae bacterium]